MKNKKEKKRPHIQSPIMKPLLFHFTLQNIPIFKNGKFKIVIK